MEQGDFRVNCFWGEVAANSGQTFCLCQNPGKIRRIHNENFGYAAPSQFILYINPNTVRINRFILTVTYGYPYYKLIYGKDNFIYPKDKSLRTAERQKSRIC